MKTIKWIITILVSVGVGTFVDVIILEKMDINIWLSRGIGCLITVAFALVMHHYLIGKKIAK